MRGARHITRGVASRSVSLSSVWRKARKNRGVTPSLANTSPIRNDSASADSPFAGASRSSVANAEPEGLVRGILAMRTPTGPAAQTSCSG